MPPDPRIVEAQRLVAEARRLNDDPRKTADDQRKAHTLVQQAQALRAQVELDADLKSVDDWISEPQHKHDMRTLDNNGSPVDVTGKTHDRAVVDDDNPFAAVDKAKSTRHFFEYLSKGDRATPEAKASIVEDATGDLLVPTDYAGTITKTLSRVSTIRPRASVYPTRSDRVVLGNISVGTPQWGRLEVIGSTTDALGTPGSDTLYVHELTALAKIGQDELADSPNLESIVRNLVADKFAEVEDDAFAMGTGGAQTGNSRPAGFAWRATAAGGPTVTQGLTAGANATVTADNLRSLPFQVPARFRNGAAYYVSEDAAAAIALLKDGQGNYLAPDPTSLLGYPMVVVGGMPSMSTTGTATDPSTVFGNLNAAYLIVDHVSTQGSALSVQVLRERYADEGKVGILFKKRVGGEVVRPAALARLQL